MRLIVTEERTVVDEHGAIQCIIPTTSRIAPCEVAEALRRHLAATPVVVEADAPAELLQWLREHYERGARQTPSWMRLDYINLSERAALAGYTTEQIEACKRALGVIRA